MYISILFDLKLLQGFLELPGFMPKNLKYTWYDGQSHLPFTQETRTLFMCISDRNLFRASGEA